MMNQKKRSKEPTLTKPSQIPVAGTIDPIGWNQFRMISEEKNKSEITIPLARNFAVTTSRSETGRVRIQDSVPLARSL